MSKQDKHFYDFEPFRIDVRKRLLMRDGEVLSLTPKAFDTLLALVEGGGRVMEKDELMREVWPDTIVEESALSRNIYLLRKTLGESPDEHRFIVTVPGRGYRFVASIRELMDEPVEVIVATRTRASVVTEEEEDDGEVRGWGDWEMKGQPSALAPSPRRSVTWSVLAGALLLLAIVAGGAYWWKSSSRNLQSAIKSIAVLPFKPLVADSRDEYLQMGMADVLITRLSNLHSLTVRPTSAVRNFAAPDQDALTAGRTLQVAAVLDGNFQRVGDRVRVTARLLNTEDGSTILAETFDEKFTDIFRVQDQLSEKLARALAPKLTGTELQRLAKRGTENSEAFQAYAKGRYFWAKWSEPSLRKSVESFEQAIAADPNYALAYAGLADAWNLLGYLGFVPPREAFPKSEAAAQQALKLDDSLGEAHHALSKTRLFYDWNWPEFERESQRVTDLIPNFADAYGMRGTYLTAMGRFDEAIAARHRVLELDPSSALATTMMGWPYFYARRYDEAIAWYQKALELDSNFVQAHNDIGLSASLLGKNDLAVNEWLKGRSLSGEKPETIEALRQIYASQGIKGYWQKELESTLAQMQQQRVRPWRLAGIYHSLGDREQTFAWLEKACDERDGLMPFLKVMPQYQDLHNDPRFTDLLRRIGLTQ